MAGTHPSIDVAARDPAMPSSGVRTTWTLLLIVHLAAVLLTVLANASPVSELRSKLGDVPMRLYLQALHMDSAYNFHLTDGDPLDLDHAIEIELESPAGAADDAEPEIIRLPPDDIWPGVRKRRYQQLARAVADRATETDPTFAGELPDAIATGLLSQADVDSGTHQFRSVRQQVVELDNAGHPDRARSDPNHPDRFEAAHEWTLLCDAGDVEVLKIVPKSQRATVRRKSPTDGTNDR
jgi:hypothetical protein